MTSETDHPRQRTVAELLAAHGDGAATGRRHRRRAADGPDDVESSGGSGGYAPSRPSYDYAPPAAPDRRILREPVPQDDAPYRAPEGRRPSAYDAPPREAPREIPTDRMPRVPERAPQRFAEPPPPPPPPARAQRPPMGAPAGAEPWNRPRTEQPRIDQRPDDGGPPTQAGALDLDDDYEDDEYEDEYRDDDYRDGTYRDDDDDEYDDEYDEDGYDDDPRRARGIAGLRDDDSDDLDEYEDEFDDDEDEDADERPSRRRQREDEPVGAQSWGAVVAQWIIGAIGGAMLWVAFRFLWRDLMVVAIFAAILVTAGLVLGVRHLLRTTDIRTTAFAIGVGLLLTVSPVVLILLGR
jgi:hypothetical protein